MPYYAQPPPWVVLVSVLVFGLAMTAPCAIIAAMAFKKLFGAKEHGRRPLE